MSTISIEFKDTQACAAGPRTDRGALSFKRGLPILAAAVVLAASVLWAQETPGASGPPGQETPSGDSSVSAGADGFSIADATGEYRLQFRAYVQFDGRFFSSDPRGLGIDTFALRRVRPVFQGSIGRYFDFKVMPDFGGGTATIQDAWLEFKPSPMLRVRVGKDKAPVGLERLQSATALHFVERAFPTLLLPNRDVGVLLHGELAGGIMSWAAGVFNGAPDGGSVDRDLDDHKDLAARVFLSPFKRGKSRLRDLGFGISGTTGRHSGPLPTLSSTGQVRIETPLEGVVADGTHRRHSPQLSFYRGPLGLLAEYAWSESWVKAPDGSHLKVAGSAWAVTASVSLTGDKASYAGVRPGRPFDPSTGRWGALELAARVHGLELDRRGFEAGAIDIARSVRRVVAWAVGLNWTLTRNVKQVIDFERATFTGGAASGKHRDPENVVLIRTQVSF